MKAAICPGTYDPITNGHVNIILRAAKMFDIVYVAVMENIEKKTVFSAQERYRFATTALEGQSGVKVIHSSKLLAQLVDDYNACAVVKGVRNGSDFEYEFQLSMINRSVNPHAETLLIPADGAHLFLSSTVVRDVGRHGGDISGYVPERIATEVAEKLKERYGNLT